MDPKIAELKAQLDAVRSMVEKSTAAAAVQTMEQIDKAFNEGKFKLINDIRSFNEDLKEGMSKPFQQLAADMSELYTRIKTQLDAQVTAQTKAKVELANTLTSILRLNEAESEKYVELMTKVGTSTGDALDEAKRELNAYTNEMMAAGSMTVNFANKQKEYSDLVKRYILDSGATFDKMSESAKKLIAPAIEALGYEKDRKLSAQEVDKVLEKLNLTEAKVIENGQFFADVLNRQSIAYANLTANIAKTRKELEIFDDAQKAIKQNSDSIADATNNVNNSMAAFADKLALASGQSNMFGSAIMSALSFITDEKGNTFRGSKMFATLWDGITASFMSYEKAINRVFNFLDQRLLKSTFEFNRLNAEINKMTGGQGEGFRELVTGNKDTKVGAVKEFLGVQENPLPGLAIYGTGVKELGQAYGGLSRNISDFNNLSRESRLALAASATAFQSLNVTTETYSQTITNFRINSGRSIEAARKDFQALAQDAVGLKLDVSKYAEEFNRISNSLLGFAKSAKDSFKDLNALAQAAKGGLTATDLAQFSDKFDTLEGAAETVSKLNAALGGTSVNIMDMMRAESPTERIMTILRAQKEAGVQFDELNRGFKKLMAEPFGGDMTKAAAFYNTTLEDAQRMLDRQSATEEQLAKRRAASASAEQKLAAALDNVKIALSPIADIFNGIASVITWLNKTMSPTGTFAVALIGLSGLAIAAWNKFATKAVEQVNRVISSFTTLAKEMRAVVAQLEKMNTEMGHFANLSEAAEHSAGKRGRGGMQGPELPKPKSGWKMAGSAGKYAGYAFLATEVLSLLGRSATKAAETGLPENEVTAGDDIIDDMKSMATVRNYNVNNQLNNTYPGRTNVTITQPDGLVRNLSGSPNDKVILAQRGGPVESSLNFMATAGNFFSRLTDRVSGMLGAGISSVSNTSNNFMSYASSALQTLGISNSVYSQQPTERAAATPSLQRAIERNTNTLSTLTQQTTKSKEIEKNSFLEIFTSMFSGFGDMVNHVNVVIGEEKIEKAVSRTKAMRDMPEKVAQAMVSKAPMPGFSSPGIGGLTIG